MRQGKEQAEFPDFRNLQTHGPKIDPALRAVNRHANPGNQNRHQCQNSTSTQNVGKRAQSLQVDLHRESTRRNGNHQPGHLFSQENRGVVMHRL
jgi:hypothetical protein